MTDPLDEVQTLPMIKAGGEAPRTPWDARIEKILGDIRRESLSLMVLGLFVYGGGSFAILYFMRNQPPLATAAVMFFFQLLVIIFSTTKIYPCIKGAFRTGLESTRDTVPAMLDLRDAIREVRAEKDAFRNDVKKASLDIQAEGARIRGEVARIGDALNRKIEPPVKRIEIPPVEGLNDASGPETHAQGNGDGRCLESELHVRP